MNQGSPLQSKKDERSCNQESTKDPATVNASSLNGERAFTQTVSESPVNLQPEPPVPGDRARGSIAPGQDGQARTGMNSLGRILGNSEDTGAGGESPRRNGNTVQTEIITILADRGCDPSFRQIVARVADFRIIKRLAAEYDRTKGTIRIPGGWWRHRLRHAGVGV